MKRGNSSPRTDAPAPRRWRGSRTGPRLPDMEDRRLKTFARLALAREERSGDLVYQMNVVLGRIALAAGDEDEAGDRVALMGIGSGINCSMAEVPLWLAAQKM